MVLRGEIKNRSRSLQVKDYSGLRYGNITPTDIDGLVEFRGKLLIYLEFKSPGAPILPGQRRALESAVDLCREHVIATCVIAEHDTPVEMDIDCSTAIVVEYRWHGVWRKPKLYCLTVKQFIDKMLYLAGLKFLISEAVPALKPEKHNRRFEMESFHAKEEPSGDGFDDWF